MAICLVPAVLCACETVPPVQPVPIVITAGEGEIPGAQGLAGEIRSLIEHGSPHSLAGAVDLIQNRSLDTSEYGRLMNAIAAAIFRSVYPDTQAHYLPPDPPSIGVYARILREAGKGVYITPPDNSRDFLEYVLPLLAYYQSGKLSGDFLLRNQELWLNLERASRLNPSSVLPPLFQGALYEQNGDDAKAEASYNRALKLADDCYPAELGLARIMDRRGEQEDVFARLNGLLTRYPGNIGVKKELARIHAARGEWSEAEAITAEILRRDPRDGEFLLLKAFAALEQGDYYDASSALDIYALIDSGNRQYLFLRARLQAEAYHNRESALTYLRSLVRSYPGDIEARVYMAGLLVDSPRPEDAAEGRTILADLLRSPDPPAELLALAVKDAVHREAWQEARQNMERLFAVRRYNVDLLNAARVERGLGNYEASFVYARELFALEPSGEDAVFAYITALIDTGRRSEASTMIGRRLSTASGGGQKSRYYYLRSRLRPGGEAAMNDLRSSLFEDPRNFNALTAMFEIYHNRGDIRRAVFYLKQALSIAPDNPTLKRHEAEYRAALGSSY
jgi:tetratricopeptide (TPR) repeat protein